MINIRIDKSKKIFGINTLYVSFDKYNPDLIDVIRHLPERTYNDKTKEWEVPLYKLGSLINLYKTHNIKISLNKEKIEKSKIPKEHIFNKNPFPHQFEGIEFILNKPKCILGDDMGLGKTFQALHAAKIRMEKGEIESCLILCGVNSLKYNWRAEIKEHLDMDSWVIGTRYRKRNNNEYMGTTQDKIDDVKNVKCPFLITNVETLISDKFIKELNKRKDIQMIILDECHKCNQASAQRTKNLLKLEDFKYKLAMSGTPTTNAPTDIHTMLTWLDYEHCSKSVFDAFYEERTGFNNTEFKGYRNLDILKKELDNVMLRRLKEEVLDLPEKIFSNVYLEMNEEQTKIYQEAETWVFENIDLISKQPNPLASLIRLRQATGYTGILSSTIQESAKLDYLEHMVEQLLKNGQKCIIVSNWTSITDEVIKRFSGYDFALMTGQNSAIKNKEQEYKFQNDPNCKICIGTIGVMGTGWTLTESQNVIFLDLPFTYTAYSQCTDRIHRIGQTGTCNVYNLLCKGTIDEMVYNLIYKKKRDIEAVFKGTPEQKKEFIYELLNVQKVKLLA